MTGQTFYRTAGMLPDHLISPTALALLAALALVATVTGVVVAVRRH